MIRFGPRPAFLLFPPLALQDFPLPTSLPGSGSSTDWPGVKQMVQDPGSRVDGRYSVLQSAACLPHLLLAWCVWSPGQAALTLHCVFKKRTGRHFALGFVRSFGMLFPSLRLEFHTPPPAVRARCDDMLYGVLRSTWLVAGHGLSMECCCVHPHQLLPYKLVARLFRPEKSAYTVAPT